MSDPIFDHDLTPDPIRESRRIASLHTVRLTRPFLKMSSMSSNNPLGKSLELDSHADMTVLGAGALMIQSYDQPVEVFRYDPQQGLQTFELISSDLAFDQLRDR